MALVAAVAGGAGLVVALSGSPAAAYGPSGGGNTGATTTTTGSTTTTSSSTTTSSTTSTTTGNNGNATSDTVGVSSTTVPPGATVTVVLETHQGNQTSQGGHCAPGSQVNIDLQQLQNGTPFTVLATVTADNNGGIPATQVTIPANAPAGNTFVIYAQCFDVNGNLTTLTSPLVTVSNSSAVQTAVAPATFSGSAQSNPSAVQAINSEIARSTSASPSVAVGNASSLPNGGLTLITPKNLVFPNSDPAGSSSALSYGLAAAVVVLVASGLLALRWRRRAVPQA